MAKRSIRRVSIIVFGCVVAVALLGCGRLARPPSRVSPTVETARTAESSPTVRSSARHIEEATPAAERPPTTVLLVRHAEVATQSEDPPLSAAGRARAEALVHVVGDAGVTAIYATQFLRTQETVRPLATYLGLSVNQVDAEDVQGLVDRVFSERAGEVVLIAGHSPTVPMIIQALGGDQRPPIPGNKYDHLFVVTVNSLGQATVLQLKYGEPS